MSTGVYATVDNPIDVPGTCPNGQASPVPGAHIENGRFGRALVHLWFTVLFGKRLEASDHACGLFELELERLRSVDQLRAPEAVRQGPPQENHDVVAYGVLQRWGLVGRIEVSEQINSRRLHGQFGKVRLPAKDPDQPTGLLRECEVGKSFTDCRLRPIGGLHNKSGSACVEPNPKTPGSEHAIPHSQCRDSCSRKDLRDAIQAPPKIIGNKLLPRGATAIHPTIGCVPILREFLQFIIQSHGHPPLDAFDSHLELAESNASQCRARLFSTAVLAKGCAPGARQATERLRRDNLPSCRRARGRHVHAVGWVGMVLLLLGGVASCTAPNPAIRCSYSETSPQEHAGDAYCAVEPGEHADKILHLVADELDLDLLMTPSTEPPSVAFALTLRAPAIDCPLTGGSWVTDGGGTIGAHIYCGDALVAFVVTY